MVYMVTKSSHRLIIRKMLSGGFLSEIRKLAGINEDSDKISDDFLPDRTIGFGVTRPGATKIFHILIIKKMLSGG